MKPYHAHRSGHSSHDAFRHDSIDSLGYDWERIADPGIPPQHPFKIYLPQTRQDVAAVMQEVKGLKQELLFRSMGHSSNDLVLAPNGVILCTERINYLEIDDSMRCWTIREVDRQGKKGRILLKLDPRGKTRDLMVPAPEGAILARVDFETMTLQLPGGAVLADVDRNLGNIPKDKLPPGVAGIGLPIIGDNNHITAGGFASVGGISPASHRFGLFVDNVQELEYVNRAGTVTTCSAKKKPAQFRKVLTGLGRHGVITRLTCDLIAVDKSTIIENERKRICRDVDQFVRFSRLRLSMPEPGKYLFHRGMWIDFLRGGRNLLIGQFSSYVDTAETPGKRRRRNLQYGFLHFLGKWAGRLPDKLLFIELVIRLLGILGIVVFPPRYGTIKDAESFTDRVIDYSEGEPWRMLTLFVPLAGYELLFRKIYELCLVARRRDKVVGNISIYVKPVVSGYLKDKVAKVNPPEQGEASGHFVELTFLVFFRREIFADAGRVKTMKQVFDQLVLQVDRLCDAHGAYRYMPTKTSKVASLEKKINPNHYP